MHRVVTPEGKHRPSEFLRWVRTVAYFLMALSGLLLVLSPYLLTVYGVIGEVMSWFLIVGGLLSAVGAVSWRWFGEFTGLPLLASAFAVFGVLTYRLNHDSFPYVAGANLSLLLAIALVMLARWRVVFAVYRFVAHLGKAGQAHG